jgi:hypothetical protein
MVDTLSSRIDAAQGEAIEEDVQWWANRFRYASRTCVAEPSTNYHSSSSLDSIGLAGFSYNFNSISGNGNSLAAALEALTNTSHNFSSFVMRAFFFTFPSILKSMCLVASCLTNFNVAAVPSEKGKYIRNTREELGKVATKMWNEAKAADSDDEKTLMALMSVSPILRLKTCGC